jgi:hypothetical protein
MEMTFFNPNNRVLEGELQFPLLDGQSIAGFALDVNGTLRDAVPVEKARGQAVFEDIIRRRVDPALLEVTNGNNFKLRVYPLPPGGTRRVLLRVSETLTKNVYRIPLGFGERIGQLDLDVRISGVTATPSLRTNTLIGAAFSPEPVNKISSFRLHDKRADFISDLALDVVITPTGAQSVQTEHLDGKNYFVASIPVNSRESARSIPNSIGLLWDSSGSSRQRDRMKEFALLDAYFKKMRDGEVRLTRIRDVAEKTEIFPIRAGAWNTLREALETTPYYGASNLSAFMPDSTVREYLFFTDGLSNYGDKPFAQTTVPLYAISAATKADYVFLKHIAQRSGGRYIDLNAESTAEASRSLLNASTRLLHATSFEASDILAASPFAQNGRLQIAGIMGSNQATLQLTLQHPDGVQETIDTSIADSLPSISAAQRWATLKVAMLDAEYALNRGEIKRLGQKFQLVTRETSLIVLELVEDYARFEIAPPKELRAEFDRITSQIAMQQRSDRGNHLNQVIRAFEDKVAWWKREFNKGDQPKVNLLQEGSIGSATISGERDTFNGKLAQVAPQQAKRMPAPPVVSAPASTPAHVTITSAGAAGAVSNKPTSVDAAMTANAETNHQTGIRVQKWQPDAAYAQRLKNTQSADLYRVYLDEMPNHLNSTAFYLDAADVLLEKGMTDLGLRVLSNLAEMDLENRHILRVLGYRLMQANRPLLAIPVLKKVLALSPEEPQSYRDLGLAYAKNNQPQLAIDTLNEVIVRPWHGRFPEIELITLAELNAIIATSPQRLDTGKIDARLIKNLPLDVRAVLTWDADNTDIDLWVTDPNGEKAYYGNPLTYQGGRMSQDFTGGYGPEEFSLRKAKPGKYRVEANYFGDRRQNLAGATTLQMQLITGFGMRKAQEQVIILRLKDRSETVYVGEFEVK